MPDTLPSAKSELNRVRLENPQPLLPRYLGIIAAMMVRDMEGVQASPRSKQQILITLMRASKTVSVAQTITVPERNKLLSAGYQSLIYDIGHGVVRKYILETLGASDRLLDAYLSYEQFCIDEMIRIFGDQVTEAAPVVGDLPFNMIGNLPAVTVMQPYVDYDYDLFSPEGLRAIQTAPPGSQLFLQTIRFLDSANRLYVEHGIYPDILGRSNVVISGGNIVIIDYDPNEHDGPKTKQWQFENYRDKKLRLEILKKATDRD
jgi:hypothetical protein